MTRAHDYIDAPATRARLASAIANCADHLRPVLIAVKDYRVGMMFVSQAAGPFKIPEKPKGAAVLLVGDDMHISLGPDGFHMPSIRRAIRACSGFAVVSGAPTADVYAAVTACAVGGRHGMIVETRLEHEFQWVALIQKLAPGRPMIISTVKGGAA